ncbi:hypothetical protein TSAR_003459, partial [Trichomalopsis sarcophagae]
ALYSIPTYSDPQYFFSQENRARKFALSNPWSITKRFYDRRFAQSLDAINFYYNESFEHSIPAHFARKFSIESLVTIVPKVPRGAAGLGNITPLRHSIPKPAVTPIRVISSPILHCEVRTFPSMLSIWMTNSIANSGDDTPAILSAVFVITGLRKKRRMKLLVPNSFTGFVDLGLRLYSFAGSEGSLKF